MLTAKVFVPSGAPFQVTAGDSAAPSQVQSTDRKCFSSTEALLTSKPGTRRSRHVRKDRPADRLCPCHLRRDHDVVEDPIPRGGPGRPSRGGGGGPL